jgi:hypothetical protein
MDTSSPLLGSAVRHPGGTTTERTWLPWAALAFATGYAGLRLYWATGGRWGYTACSPSADTGFETGCGADQLRSLSIWSGWGAVGLAVALVVVTGWLIRSRTGGAALTAWVACAVLVVASFPMHLLFQLPAAIGGHPTDWRDVAHRLVLITGAVAVGAAARSARDRSCRPTPVELRPQVPVWARRAAYASCVIPVVGWAIPHGLWMLNLQVGVSASTLREIQESLVDSTPMVGVALVLAPVVGGVLSVGLARRWGQVVPAWVPVLRGRTIPRLLVLVPASVVALSLVAYGLISSWVLVADVRSGDTSWSELWAGWAVALTVVVFLGWGVALALAAWGYHLVTRPQREDAHVRGGELPPVAV